MPEDEYQIQLKDSFMVPDIFIVSHISANAHVLKHCIRMIICIHLMKEITAESFASCVLNGD